MNRSRDSHATKVASIQSVFARHFTRAMFDAADRVTSLKVGGLVNKGQWRSQALRTLAVVALVLVTNECYRYGRAALDYVHAMEDQVKTLSLEVRSLRDQVKASPVQPIELNAPVMPVALRAPPIPLPIGPAPVAALEPSPRPQTKNHQTDEAKSLVNVVLMSDAKVGADMGSSAATTSPVVAVKLLGDAK